MKKNAHAGWYRVLLMAGLLSGCNGVPLPNTNNNGNGNSNQNSNQNDNTGHSVDELPDLSADDNLGEGEAADELMPGMVLVGIDEAISEDNYNVLAPSLATTVGGTTRYIFDEIRLVVINLPVGTEQQAISTLNGVTGVDFAEVSYAGRLGGLTDLLPEADSVAYAQYQLFKTNAFPLADIEQISPSTVAVAVLDSGCDTSHVEIAAAQLETGWNYLANNNELSDEVAGGHGTAVVSLLAASQNAGQIAGLLPGFEISLHKICDSAGECPLDAVVAGLIGALNGNGDSDPATAEISPAQVIYLGASFSGEYQSLARAIFEAESRNVVVIAPAGNNGRSAGATTARYPGKYSTVVSVGASDINDRALPFTNRSPEMDIVAPGADLYVAAPNQQYRFVDGTCFAAAQVAAGAALVLSTDPQMTADQVRNRLIDRADDLASGSGFGSGVTKRLNLTAAVLDDTASIEPYILPDQQLVTVTSVNQLSLVSNAVAGNATAVTPIAQSEQTIYWYGYFPTETRFELLDGEERVELTLDSLVPSSIDLFVEFVRGYQLGELQASFGVLQQAMLILPELGGERRLLQVVAIADGVESEPQPLLFNALQKGYNIVAYKNFNSSIIHLLEEEGVDFDPEGADLELRGSGATPEVDWTDGADVFSVQLGSSLDPLYYVLSDAGLNQISPPVSIGECTGAETAEQLCGANVQLPTNQLTRLVVTRLEAGGEQVALLDVIYVP
ncbi:MAG: hypothetical protein HJJLKODD_01106 [Phycisphaerae bacterium]|nr:hypothetical protein [Phycisphaerae bacterium]